MGADAALDRAKLKRPLSGYFTWLKDSRKSIKGKNVAEVSKKAGEMWKSLSAEKKKVYEDRASKAKTEYAAYIAKIKDTDAFKAYKGELAVARKKKLRRSVKSAMRKVPMDSSLKRPLSGYMLWFKDTRKSIKGKNVAEVGKKAGEMWKSLPADKKKTYGDRALEAKKKYSAYVATGKGAAALKAYKAGIAKAKAPLIATDEKLKAKKAAKKRKGKGFESEGKSQGGSQKGRESSQKGKGKSRKSCKDQEGGSGKSSGNSKKGCEGKSKKGSQGKKGGSSKSKEGGEEKQKGCEKGKASEE